MRAILRQQFTDKSPRDFGGLSVVIMDVESGVAPIFKFNPHDFGFGGNAVGFSDGLVWFKKCDAILKIYLERIFPSQITRAGQTHHFRLAEWSLESCQRRGHKPGTISAQQSSRSRGHN